MPQRGLIFAARQAGSSPATVETRMAKAAKEIKLLKLVAVSQGKATSKL